MANPHQQSPHGDHDPAGSTQMFRAFVDESAGAPAAPAVGGRAAARAARSSSGPRAGVILGVIVAIVVVAGAAWLALS